MFNRYSIAITGLSMWPLSHPRTLIFILAFAAFGSPRWSPAVHAQVLLGIETVAFTGTDADFGPVLESGVTFASFRTPAINPSGIIGFNGFVEGPGVNDVVNGSSILSANHEGIWFSDAAGLRPVIRVGRDQPPKIGQVPGTTFHRLGIGNFPRLGPQGQLLFTGLTTFGLWEDNAGNLSRIARWHSNGPLGPGLGPNVTFLGANISKTSYESDGDVVFRATVNQDIGGQFRGVWRVGDSGPQLVVRDRTTGEFGPNRGDESYQRLRDAALDPADNLFVTSPVVSTNSEYEGIIRIDDGPDTVFVRTGSDGALGPQLGSGVVFSDVEGRPVGVNRILVSGKIGGTGIDSTNHEGFWVINEQNIELIARTGTDAVGGPNLGSGVVFARGATTPDIVFPFISSAGNESETALVARVSGNTFDPNVSIGIWFDDGSGLMPIAMTGESGPLGPNTSANEVFSYFDHISLGGDGTLVFSGWVDDVESGASTSGLWMYDRNRVSPLLREGDELAVDTGGSRERLTVADIAWTSAGNSSRGIAARISFTSGEQGIFRLMPTIVPEPSAASLLVIPTCILLLRRRDIRPHCVLCSFFATQKVDAG